MQHRSSSDFLRTCRRSAGFSQAELARLMGFTSRSHLSRIERGLQTPQLEQALRYSLFFGIPVEMVAPRLCQTVRNGLWEDVSTQLEASDSQPWKREHLESAKVRIEALDA